MDNFPLPQEADHIADVGVVAEAQDIVIGDPGLLLGGHILGEVADHIPLDADTGGVPGSAGGGGGIDAGGMVHKIGSEAALSQLLLGESPGKLMDDGTDHFQVAQFFGTYRGTKMAPKAQNLCAATDSGNLSSAEYN